MSAGVSRPPRPCPVPSPGAVPPHLCSRPERPRPQAPDGLPLLRDLLRGADFTIRLSAGPDVD
ncbi:hypothetical protein B6E66_31870 [Streptomyces maremycinicus]|nr:hypothetical protein B6E66_31870 [Streptomyces sp. B9173]